MNSFRLSELRNGTRRSEGRRERKGVAERDGAVRERQGVMREKDRATMEMLKKMAKERFRIIYEGASVFVS